jgi:hypothetical protein
MTVKGVLLYLGKYNTYLTKEYNSHPGLEISILEHQHQCQGEMVLQDSSNQFVTWT